MIRAAIVLAALSASTASAQYAVRYEFDIRVTSNTVTPGSGNTLEPLAVGTVGTYTIDVLNDIDVFPTDDPGFIQIYPVLDFELNIAGVVSGPRPGIYPGAFIHGVFIENDTDTNSFTQVKDNFFVNPIFDNTDFGFSVLYLAEILPFPPQLIDDLARTIHDAGCERVFCDIAPMGVAVAQAAGLPAVSRHGPPARRRHAPAT